MIVSDRLVEPFRKGDDDLPARLHLRRPPGVRRRGAGQPRPVRARGPATATCCATRPRFRATLERLHDLPIVGDVRGDGYFYGIELVKDKATKETFDDEETERLLRGFLSKALFENGLYCRADDRGDPVVQLAPPLICDQSRLRRDRADPALGADRGLEQALTSPGGTPDTRVRRLPEKAVSDVAALHAVLDEALVAHVAVVDGERPVVLPMACARDGDQLLLHGSTGSRVMRLLAGGADACATVTLLDGLVLARSAFESSMRYRSVVVLGPRRRGRPGGQGDVAPAADRRPAPGPLGTAPAAAPAGTRRHHGGPPAAGRVLGQGQRRLARRPGRRPGLAGLGRRRAAVDDARAATAGPRLRVDAAPPEG